MGSRSFYEKGASSAMHYVVFGINPNQERQTSHELSKGERKKCKSCLYYPCGNCKKPMQVACECYIKKKK
ncbi:MAG: hypothetical protein II604_00440 [Bacteroidales bacterium]|nr:hypothetical protein [Bacteroidales bacterium]